MSAIGIGILTFVGLLVVFRLARRFRRRRHGGRREWMVRRLLRELKVTPEQEPIVRAVVEELFEALGEERGVFREARAAASNAVRGDDFDVDVLADLLASQDASLRRVHAAFESALERLHAVFDGFQRERLADLIAQGGRRHPGCGRARAATA